jgi:hypothetical protein
MNGKLFELIKEAEGTLSREEFIVWLDSMRNLGANYQLMTLGFDAYAAREKKNHENFMALILGKKE